jgi:hypothetical protein
MAGVSAAGSDTSTFDQGEGRCGMRLRIQGLLLVLGSAIAAAFVAGAPWQ